MNSIEESNPAGASEALAKGISTALKKGKVLWLVCGGSNIPLSVAAMDFVRSEVPFEDLERLTVALTDERYGPVGHADSNWKQLMDAGFSFPSHTIPVLTGKPLEETVTEYARNIAQAFADASKVIAQFGIGADGHIAGVLPHTVGVADTHTICAYDAPPYTRITLTLSALKKVSAAYAFVFGSSKHDMLMRLQNETVSLADMPSQILKELPQAYLYTD